MIKILRESNELKQIPLDCIKGVTVLSVDEAENLLTREERYYSYDNNRSCWWLRDPGSNPYLAAQVNKRCDVIPEGRSVDDVIGVVPALILSNDSRVNFKIGDVFDFGNYRFRIISRNYAICEEVVGESIYRIDCDSQDANIYEKSDLKKFVDDWFNKVKRDIEHKEAGQETDDEIFGVWTGW